MRSSLRVPIVDLSVEDESKLVEAVKSSLEEFGFLLIEHFECPTMSQIHEMEEAARSFFNLPLEEKMQIEMSRYQVLLLSCFQFFSFLLSFNVSNNNNNNKASMERLFSCW